MNCQSINLVILMPGMGKLQNLKKSIFQDILDRGGFKAIDQIQHSGKVDVNPLANLSEEELRRLANGPRAT